MTAPLHPPAPPPFGVCSCGAVVSHSRTLHGLDAVRASSTMDSFMSEAARSGYVSGVPRLARARLKGMHGGASSCAHIAGV